jgi:hypothetical protein
MAKQIPWDDQTDGFISELDDSLSKKYGMSIRSLLLNPSKYMGKKGLNATVGGIRADVEAYFAALLGSMKDEQAKLDSELESADTQYREIDSLITNKAATARVPYVKPFFLTRNQDKEETIVIDKYDESLEAFVGKLVSISNFVADVSAVYKQYRLGSWVFSGVRNYVLNINPPASPVLVMDNSKVIINSILDEIETSGSE